MQTLGLEQQQKGLSVIARAAAIVEIDKLQAASAANRESLPA
jgi:hypothetical protein